MAALSVFLIRLNTALPLLIPSVVGLWVLA
jgi:hypothetical protein